TYGGDAKLTARARTLFRTGPADSGQPGRWTQARLCDAERHRGAGWRSPRSRHPVWRPRAARATRSDRTAGRGPTPPAIPAHPGRRHLAACRTLRLAQAGQHRSATAGGAGMKWLLGLYPARWRRCYGDELLALVEERGWSLAERNKRGAPGFPRPQRAACSPPDKPASKGTP